MTIIILYIVSQSHFLLQNTLCVHECHICLQTKTENILLSVQQRVLIFECRVACLYVHSIHSDSVCYMFQPPVRRKLHHTYPAHQN